MKEAEVSNCEARVTVAEFDLLVAEVELEAATESMLYLWWKKKRFSLNHSSGSLKNFFKNFLSVRNNKIFRHASYSRTEINNPT